MGRTRRATLVLAGAIWAGVVLLCARAEAQSSARYRPDEVIVRYRTQARPVDRSSVLARAQGRTVQSFPFIGAELVRLQGVSVDEAVARFRADPMVEYAEPNYELHALVTPDDPLLPQMYALRNTGQTGGTPGADIRAIQAWDLFTGDPDLKIGVIDTGVDHDHPDLSANIWTNPGEIPGNGVDDDANGYVDDVHGYDFVNDDGDPFDDNGHGTHCAGTIAATGNNGLGVVGVNWRARIVAIKFLNAGGNGSTADAIASVQYAIRVGVRLTSNSWGGGEFSQALLDAINAAGEAGQLFVAAAGNAATNVDTRPVFPVSYDSPYILGVAATDHNDRLASFSNWGPAHVQLAAPGVSILSTVPGGGYGLLSGTSMATPHVAGAVAFVLGRFPGMSALLARRLILDGVDSIPALEGIVGTSGRLNLLTPVLEPDSIRPAPIADLAVTGRSSNTLELTWTATGDDSITGRAVRYDLRRSTAPITDATFAAATPVPAPDPGPQGATERFEVRGLAFNTTYYLAVRALDEFSNAGAISNVVSGTTLGIPDATVAPGSLFQELLTGATATGTVTLRNDGEGTLDWTIPAPSLLHAQPVPHEYLPLPKGAADPRAPVIGSAGGPDAFGYRWADSDEPGGPEFSWVDISAVGTRLPISGDDVSSAPVTMGIVFPFYGNTFTTVRVTSNGFLSFTDPSAPFSNQPLPNSGAPANMIAAMWDDLFLGVPSRVYTHEDGGRFIVTWEGVERFGEGGPYTFQVILFPSGEIRLQYLSLQPPTDNATVGVQNGNRTIGFTTAFNTEYLHDNLAVRISRAPDWLVVEPRGGRLAAGQSVPIEMRFNAIEALGGDYTARVDVESNDPDEPTTTIPVTLRVIGAPDIVVEGVERTLVSQRVFAGDGATTTHTLPVGDQPSGPGVFEVIADGDYGDVSETATLTVEGNTLGQVGGAGGDCAPSAGNFTVGGSTLAALAADGVVNAVVQNNSVVGAFCVLNRHTVRLRYRLGTDSLRFGEVFLGACRAETLVVRNRGTDSLRVSAVSVSDPLYTATPDRFVLGVGESRGIVVAFCPPAAVGDRPASLTFQANDPDAPSHTVGLAGRGVVPPDVGVSPASLSADLLSGQSATRLLRLENTGGSDLRFDISQNTPAPAAVAPGPRPESWVRVGGDDPVSSRRPDGYSPAAPERRTTGGARALLIMDELPWGTTSDQAVLTANDIPYDIIPSVELAGTDLTGYRLVIVASDQPNSSYIVLRDQAEQIEAYVAEGGTLEFHAAGWGWSAGDASIVPLPGGVRINPRLADQNRVLIPTHATMAGLPNPFSGTSCSHAYLSNLPERALQVTSDLPGNPTMVEYRHGLGVVLVSCHTLEFGFTSGQAAGLILAQLIPYAYNYSPPWLTVEPARGTVPAGTGLDLAVRIDTATLLGGAYRGEVRIASNDPDESPVDVPVDLRVTGIPDLELSAAALDFGSVFVGFARADTVRVVNLGTAALAIAGLAVDDGDFAVDGAGFVLGPGGRRDLPVTWRPTRAGAIEATLRVTSNDPDEETAAVVLRGAALVPPAVGATPDSLSAALPTGQTALRTMTVTNTGGSLLTLEVAAIGRVSEDAAQRQAQRYERGPDPREAPPWVPAEPTPNETEPTAGPVITAGDYTGDYLRIGISNFGEILPFEYPDGSEHLAVLNYLSGYTVAYEADGSDHVALSGIGSRIGIVPISYREITNSTALLVAEAVTRTQDARLQITRRFTFMKSEKAVQVRTTLHDLTAAGLRRVVFKEWADWDVDGNDQNIWDYDRVRNMVYARRFRFAGIAGLEAPAFMDVNGWNDYGRRATTVEVPSGPYAGDGIEVLHYELGDLGPLQSRAVVTGYGVGDDLGELQRVVDRVLVSGSWLAFDPDTLEIPAGESREVAVTIDPGTLLGGRYDAFVELRSNDPYRPVLRVPAHLEVAGIADIALEGAQVELVSTHAYAGDAARTIHTLPVAAPPTGGGTIELVADGDFGDPAEQASLILEGRIMGQTGGTGTDCRPAPAAFTLDAATLAALAADGAIGAEVQNTSGVSAVCDVNRHTVRVRYRLNADSLRFGQVFVGQARELSLAVRNAGTDNLAVGVPAVEGVGFELLDVGSFPLTLTPGERVVLGVRFAPGSACETCAGTVTIPSSDPDEAAMVVALAGIGAAPPDIAVTPAAIDATVSVPGIETRTVTIANAGPSELAFTLTPAAPAPGPALLPAGTAWPPDVRRSTGDPVRGATATGERDSGPLEPLIRRLHGQSGSVLLIADGGTESDVQTILTAAGYAVTQVIDDDAWTGTNPSPQGFTAVVLLDGIDHGDDMPVGGQQALMDYVTAGGGLILTEWIAYETSNGRYNSMRPLIPLTRLNGVGGTFHFGVAQNHPVTDGVSPTFPVSTAMSTGTANSGTPVVTRLGDGSPMAIVKGVGRGRVVEFSIAGNFDAYRPFNVPDMQRLLVNAADWVGASQWLTVSPSAGSVPAGGQVEVEVRIDARTLTPGVYRDSIRIASNDPDEAVVDVPVTLDALAVPDIEPDSASVNFGLVFVGQSRTQTLQIRNQGLMDLEIASASIAGPGYDLTGTASFPIRLGPAGVATLSVRFTPAAPCASCAGTLAVTSNDPDEGTLSVPLTGRAAPPPDVADVPRDVRAAAATTLGPEPMVRTRTMRIRNTGGSPLEFSTVATSTADSVTVRDSLAVESSGLPQWLSVSPASGSIPPGGSADLVVRFDAKDLPDGDYTGGLAIQTNDPDESTLLVPCALHVGVMSGALDVDPNALNRNSNGRWVSVDLEVPPGLDAHALALASVRLQRGLPIADGAPTSFRDSDHDGVQELRCKFDRERLMAMLPDGAAVPVEAIGEIPDVTWFQALDVVRIMRPGVPDPPPTERIYLPGSQVLLEWLEAPDSAAVHYDLWYSGNGGESWTLSMAGLTGRSCVWTVPDQTTDAGRLELVALDAQGVRGSWLSGNLRIQSNVTAVAGRSLPVQLELRHLGENPARGDARFELGLPEPARVDVEIYDVRGAMVRRLAGRIMDSGWHTLDWDGRDETGWSAGAGVYFVRMAAGGRRLTVRLALVR